MHELSLCAAIADIALEHARDRPVSRISLRIGYLRQVVPETLQYCWRLWVEGGSLEGCDLVVDHVPVTIECRVCSTVTTLEDPVLRCGTCDGVEVTMRTGDEFLVESVDLASQDVH